MAHRPTETLVHFDMRHYLTDVYGHYHQGRPGFHHPKDRDQGVMPPWDFDLDHIESILIACKSSKRPARWGGEPGIYQVESRAWYEWHWTRGQKLRPDPGYTPRSRRHIPDSLRLAVYERDSFACLHCGATDRLSLDHIHPYSLGGADTLKNLQTLCRPCNSRKGAKV